jgi:predicted enzyme related to lactoylglutathione lyase
MENTICHFEIPADDVEAARKFYAALFDWTIEPAPRMDGKYLFVRTSKQAGVVAGGILPRIDPQHGVTVYFTVASLEDSAKALEALGGKVLVPRTAVPQLGWVLTARDPQGNTLGLFEEDASAA